MNFSISYSEPYNIVILTGSVLYSIFYLNILVHMFANLLTHRVKKYADHSVIRILQPSASNYKLNQKKSC
nr:MAG TPA: hypothetical protein [Caudoviricetes sp.]